MGDEPKKKAKKAWWWSKSRCRVSPAAEEKGPKEDSHSTPHQDEVVEFKLEEEEEECHPTPQHDKVVVREEQKVLVGEKKASQQRKVDAFSTLRLKQVQFLG